MSPEDLEQALKKLQVQSEFITVDQNRVHLRVFRNQIASVGQSQPAVLLVHGAIENGRIFYTDSGKGLAPFLAAHGYDCYVIDLPGRGLSTPSIRSGQFICQTETITAVLPQVIEQLVQRCAQQPIHLVAHSWGGVLLNAAMARAPQLIPHIKNCVYFGTKRRIVNRHWQTRWQVNVLWNHVAPFVAKLYGYLPATQLRFGSDDESRQTLKQSIDWVRSETWCDLVDNFDYQQQLANLSLPPTLHIGASADKILAQPMDIQAFMAESGLGEVQFKMFGKAYGHQVDYGHVDILTQPQARWEPFQALLAYLGQSKLPSS